MIAGRENLPHFLKENIVSQKAVTEPSIIDHSINP